MLCRQVYQVYPAIHRIHASQGRGPVVVPVSALPLALPVPVTVPVHVPALVLALAVNEPVPALPLVLCPRLREPENRARARSRARARGRETRSRVVTSERSAVPGRTPPRRDQASHIPSSFRTTKRYGTRTEVLRPLRRRHRAKNRKKRPVSAEGRAELAASQRSCVPYPLVVPDDQALWEWT